MRKAETEVPSSQPLLFLPFVLLLPLLPLWPPCGDGGSTNEEAGRVEEEEGGGEGSEKGGGK